MHVALLAMIMRRQCAGAQCSWYWKSKLNCSAFTAGGKKSCSSQFIGVCCVILCRAKLGQAVMLRQVMGHSWDQ